MSPIFNAFCAPFLFLVFGKQILSEQILFANISNTDIISAICASDDYENAISWITPIEYKYQQILNGAENGFTQISFKKKKINMVEYQSHKELFGPNLDFTWECANVTVTRGNEQNFDMVRLDKLNFMDKFTINLSILAPANGHILLCDQIDVAIANCYWIILGGWDNKASIIRYCQSGKVPRSVLGAKNGPCTDLIQKVDVSPLSMKQWNHVSIQYKNDRYLRIIHNERDIMSAQLIKNKIPINNFTNLYVHSYNNNAFWKHLEYKYLIWHSKSNAINSNSFQIKTNTLCISIFIIFEGKVDINLLDFNKTVAQHKTHFSNNLKGWQHILFKAINIPNGSYELQIKSYANSSPILVRNIYQHETCTSNTMQIRFSKIQYSMQRNATVQCLPIHLHNSLYIKSADNTDLDSICNSFLNTAKCPHQMICADDNCSCRYGYGGNYCNEACRTGFYGLMCQNKCGKCKFQNECETYNGDCPNGCLANYIEPQCAQRLLPVILEIKNIPKNCINQCTIQLYDGSLSYSGKIKPEFYYTMLFEKHEFKEQSHPFNIANNNVTFRNLSKSTTYRFQVILCSMNMKCTDEDIQNYYIDTICQPLDFDQIVITTVEQTISFHFNYSEELNCDYRGIYVYVTNSRNMTDSRGFYLENNSKLENVHVYTNYTITFAKGPTKTILTDEGVPNQPDGLNAISSTASSTVLSWRAPYPVRGIITHYTVEYQWEKKIGCSIIESTSQLFKRDTTATNITFYDLLPYSIYNINVYAHTRKGRGAPRTMELKTRDKEINVNEINIIIHTNSSSVNIDAEINCDKLNGRLFIEAHLTCMSEWCFNKTKNSQKEITQSTRKFTVPDLQYFTDYIIEIYIQRNYNLLKTKPVFYARKEIKTESGPPNKVPFFDDYSKSEHSMSLRWNKPYPPTGKLNNFLVTYKESNSAKKNIVSMKFNTLCKYLEEYYCAEITNLPKGITFDVTVAAFNENVTNAGQVTSIKVQTFVNTPEYPQNIHTTWSSSNYLMLSWQRPNKTNGPLRQYEIVLNTEKYVYAENLDSWKYTFEKYKCTTDNHFVKGTIKSITTQFESSAKEFTTHCPVFEPEFADIPQCRGVSNYSISLFIPEIINFEKDSYLFILILSQKNVIGEYDKCSDDIQKNINQPKKSCGMIHKEAVTESNALSHSLEVNFTQFKMEADEIHIALVNKYNGQSSIIVKKFEFNLMIETANTRWAWWIVSILIVLLLIGAIIGIVWYIKPATIKDFLIQKTTDTLHIYSAEKDEESLPLTTTSVFVAKPVVPPKPQVPTPISKIIHISNLNAYLKEAIFNGDLDKQHEQFPRGVLKEASCGSLPDNKGKNRYKNLIAYDHTRVKLELIPTLVNSDYINANYIKSPFSEKAFIATQGPTEATIYDFWHMVLTNGVQTIIMLANLLENSKQKVHRYWPDSRKKRKTLMFEDIEITLKNTRIYFNYEVRTLIVKRNDIETEVTQLHFVSWPDHGVPMYPQSLIPFVMRIMQIPHDKNHPILIHCSAGVGRTGTIILIDICLRLGIRDKQIDILQQLALLRSQRANMVDNYKQYKLVHLVLLEFFNDQNTTYKCESFEKSIANLSDAILEEQLAYIADSAWQESAIDPDRHEPITTVANKNRHADITPDKYGCIYLRPLAEGDSSYINAVHVDGFNATKKYIATQHPLSNTVDDFWRMIIENDVHLIISLQPDYDTEFWKNEADLETTTHIKVDHLETNEFNIGSLHTLEVIPQRGEGTEVKILEANCWPIGDIVPQDLNALLATWRQVEKITRDQSATLIMCRDGATACGLFIAMSCILERIKAEHLCDVCQCVRSIRRSRKQFVTDIKQFKTLYRLAELFLSEFNIYSNFAPKPQAQLP